MTEPFVVTAFPGGPGALQSCLDRLPEGDAPVVVRLMPGVYREKVVLSRPNTTLEGENALTTRIVWDDGALTLLSDGKKRGTFRTATLRTDGDGIILKNLTVENAAGPRETAGQAIALYADGNGFTCENCRLLGAQDTLFTAPLPPKEFEKDGFVGPKRYAPRRPQRQIYRRCEIRGDIDFIFGGAAAWFEECDIVSIDGRGDRTRPCAGYAAAPSTPEGQAFGYVFRRCRFRGDGVARGSVYLARPWRDYARMVLLNCALGDHIAPEGFHDWEKPRARENAFFAEFGSTGPGAEGTRAPFVRSLCDEQARDFTPERFERSLT